MSSVGYNVATFAPISTADSPVWYTSRFEPSPARSSLYSSTVVVYDHQRRSG